MEKFSNGRSRKRDDSGEFVKNGLNFTLDSPKQKDKGYNNLYRRQHQGLKWDLTTSNRFSPNEASIEPSSEEEWSDFSFYDLPNTLKEPFPRPSLQAELLTPLHMLSRPPYHATAKAHHVHAFLDSEVANPFSSVMEDAPNQLPGCSSPTTAQVSSSHISEQSRVNHVNDENFTSGSLHRVNMVPSKRFDGSLFYRQSNLTLNDKQRGQVLLGEPQDNNFSPFPSASMSHIQVEVPALKAGASGLSGKPYSALNNHSGRSENSSYFERLQGSFPSVGGNLNSDSLEAACDTFSYRSRASSHRDKYSGTARSKKEHSPKSVSFASSVDISSKSTSPGDEEDSAGSLGSSSRNSASLRVHKVQSNVLKDQTLSESGSQNLEMRRSFDTDFLQEATVGNEYYNTADYTLPPSPPTRDTGEPQAHGQLQPDQPIHVFSLFDEKSSFVSKLSGSFTRQSNVNLSFGGSAPLQSSAQSSFGQMREGIVGHSSRTEDFTPRRHLRADPDTSLTLEELLSSGTVNSSQDSSLPTKFAGKKGNSKKEHSLDDYDHERDGLLKNLRQGSSFSLGTSQRISSALWVMKSLEASRSSNPSYYQDWHIKGRLFRRWYQKTKLKRLIRQEDEIKLQSAVSFWQTEVQQKCFSAWKNARSTQQERADKLHRKQLLQKGLNALKFAVNQHRQTISELETRAAARVMAKYWLKWQRCLQMKATARLRDAFNKWHTFKVDQDRDAMMEGKADKHVLSKNYKRWKVMYETEQKNDVASLHYKIGLLTKSWHSWRLYATQQVVKTRLNEVARVHYEEHLQARIFAFWKVNTHKALVARNLTSKRILIRAFYCWKNWAEYTKIIRLRFQSMCKENHRHKLVKQSFHHWRIRLMNRRADRSFNDGLQRKIFKLWFLRYKRNVIHRHLCKALARKGKKRRFFHRWSTYTKLQTEKREAFVGTLEHMLTRTVFNNWKQHVKGKQLLRHKELELTQRMNQHTTRKMMDRWMFAMKIVSFRKRAKRNWSSRCTRKACEAWKVLLKRKYLVQRLIDNRSIWEQLMLRRMFKKWRQQKRKVDTENERAFRAHAILMRNCKARVLQAWRVVNQEQQIISPMVARRERKEMTRVFDAWRLHVHRQRHIVDQKTRNTEKILDRYFLFWRERAYLSVKEREVQETMQERKLSRAFTAWKAYMKDQRHNRLKVRARKFQVMEKYYSAWKHKVQIRAEEKVEETGKEARNALLIRWSFKFWRKSAGQQKELRLRQQEMADQLCRTMVMKEAWMEWVRRFRAEELARNHAHARKLDFLRKIFQSWLGFTKEVLQQEMQQFATTLSGLDSSFGSFAASPFRHNLSSTFGSTFGSTLGSTPGTDALASSGYGASGRRGSGSVFTFGLPHKERDDDTASLPGRIDQIDQLLRPGSPATRVISPISILRDSRPVFPLAFNSNQSSPAPTPSPEQHLPSTPPMRDHDFSPVKSEDDTGIHSGSSESDHEHEDDRMSTASCTSFTGRSTQSDVRDRELMATETILHWRNLPLSLTFRTWLKFTRQRKLQRELLNYLTNNKINELMVKTLTTWRRELYTKVTARQHWLDTARRKYLKAWHEYAEVKRIQEERKMVADDHRRLVRLRGGFQKWKKRCTSKKKLQDLIGQWQKKAIVTERDKGSTDVIRTKQNDRSLRKAFIYWAQMTRKSQEAKRFYTERLVPKCFSAWHVLASTRVTSRRKVVLFSERRLLTMAFREWQARFHAVSLVSEFIEIKETDRLSEVLRGWHSWANGMNTRRKQSRLFRRSVELKVMREIFFDWLGRAQQLQLAKKTHETTIMRSVFVCWKDVALERARNRLAMQKFRKGLAANLVARSFRFWQQLLSHSEVSRAHSQQRDQSVLRECFEEWRNYTLEIRADKYFVIAVQKKMFLCWYDEYTARKTTRRLIHTWKTKTEEAKVLNTRAMRIADDTEKKLLRRMFTRWVQEAHKVQKAMNHIHAKIMTRAFCGLRQYVQCRVQRRKVLEKIIQNKEHKLLLSSFKTWRQRFQRNTRNMDILEEHLLKKDAELLQRCLVRWMKFMLRCKAEKSYQKKLVAKTFRRWWFALYTKKGTEKLQEKMLLRRTRKAGLHWKRFTYKVKKQAEVANNLQTQHGRRLVKYYFQQWTEKTHQMKRAKELHNRKIVKRSLVNWRNIARTRIDERKTIKSFRDDLMNKKVHRMFHNWRDALKLACNQKVLVDGQMVNHNRRVKQGCLREWRQFTLKSRAEKHRDKTVYSKYFVEWRWKTDQKLADKEKEKNQEEIADTHYQLTVSKMCFRAWLHDVKLELHIKEKEGRIVRKHFIMWKKRISLNNIATQMVDRRVYEKFWTKWRHQLIRKRVSEMMMKHEEKKRLSEVFMAWYQFTLVSRRLLKGWQMYKTKKIFRRWMQKYNES